MDQDDELALLYGEISSEKSPVQEPSVGKQPHTEPGANELGDDDESLFLQLYGDQPEQEAPSTRSDAPRESSKAAQAVASAHDGSAMPAGQSAEPSVLGEEEEEEEEGESEEDDLMITLDENAAAYEPSQNHVAHRQAPGTDASVQRADQQAIGAAPGELMDDGGAMEGGTSSIPGLGGFGSRTAIGGIPRSAIPGLGGSYILPQSAQTPVTTPATDERGTDNFQQQKKETSIGASATKQQDGAAVAAAIAAPKPTSRLLLRPEDAVFPSQWHPGLPMKLPGQTRVSPEEYREFLNLGHGDIFDVDLDAVIEAPWNLPGIDPSDFFNYGMNEKMYREYQDRIKQFRIEYTMKSQIQTLDQARMAVGASAPVREATEDDAEDEGKDRALQSTMAESRDEHYEAFVTSERPPRIHWTRYSQPWEHTIVLTGHDVVFEPSEKPQTQATAPTHQYQRPNSASVSSYLPFQRPSQAQMPPRPLMQPPPPPTGRASAGSGAAEEHGSGLYKSQGSGAGAVQSLPPPFINPENQESLPTHADHGEKTAAALPPPFFVGSESEDTSFEARRTGAPSGDHNAADQQNRFGSYPDYGMGAFMDQGYAAYPPTAQYGGMDVGNGGFVDMQGGLAFGMEEAASGYPPAGSQDVPHHFPGRGFGRGRGRWRGRGRSPGGPPFVGGGRGSFPGPEEDAPRPYMGHEPYGRSRYDREGGSDSREHYDDVSRRGRSGGAPYHGRFKDYGGARGSPTERYHHGDRGSDRSYRSWERDSRRQEGYDGYDDYRSRSPNRERKRRRSRSRSPGRRDFRRERSFR